MTRINSLRIGNELFEKVLAHKNVLVLSTEPKRMAIFQVSIEEKVIESERLYSFMDYIVYCCDDNSALREAGVRASTIEQMWLNGKYFVVWQTRKKWWEFWKQTERTLLFEFHFRT